MKLPEGRIEETFKDSERSFEDVLTDIKERSFDGYLKAISEENGRVFNSYFIFDKGRPLLVLFEEGDSQIQGERALNNALKNILSMSTTFEYHRGVDISLMAIYFPKAKIADLVPDIDTLLQKIEETKKIIEEEKKRKEEEERIRNEIKAQVKEWRENGYIVTGIMAVIDGSIDALQKVYEDYKAKISRLQELESELDEFDFEIYEKETKELLKMLNDPDKIGAIEEGIKALREKVEEDNRRREAVKKKIEQWKAEGYVTSRLEAYIDKDVEVLWDAYTKFFEDLQILEEIGEKLKDLESQTPSFKSQFNEIRSMLKDPDKIDEINARIKDLESLIEGEKKRREMLKARIGEWERNGINVDVLKEKVEAAPIEEIEKMVEEYEDILARIDVMRNKISSIARERFPQEFAALEELMKDPKRFEEIENMYNDLMRKIEEDENRRVEYRKKIQDWKSQGYVVPPMEDLFQGPMDVLEAGIKKIEESIGRLRKYEEDLQTLRTKGYEAEIMDILSRMYDLTAIKEIEEKYQNLMTKVREDEEKRNKLKKHLDDLEKEGFDVSSVRNLLDDTLDRLWDAYTTLLDNIETLKEAKERLEAINPIGHEAEVEELNKLMSNPAMADTVIQRVKALEEQVNKELQRRTEIKAILDEYKEKGYITESIESKITIPMDQLEAEFERFMNGIQVLEKLRDRLEKIDAKWYEKDISALKEQLNDPTKAEDLEVTIMELEGKIREEKMKRNEILKAAETWEEKGYAVSGLKDAIENAQFKDLEGMYNRFKEAIGRMEELKASMESIEIYGHDDEINEIKNLMKDIGNLPEVSKRVGHIIKIAEEEKSRRNEFLEKIKAWDNEGYKVAEAIEFIKTAPIKDAEGLVGRLEHDINELKRIEGALTSMKVRGHEEEVRLIQSKLKSPAEFAAVKEEFEKLKEKIAEEEKKREELRQRIDAWKNEGYNVSRLEQIIDGDLQSVIEQFEIFEGDIKHLKEIENALSNIDMKGHDEEINRIKEMCKDPEKIKDVDSAYKHLTETIEGEKKMIEQMKETIRRWKEEGYVITRLEGLDDKNYEMFKEKIGAFQEDINRLKALKSELEALDTRWHKDLAKEIEEKLNNPDAIGIIERKLDELKAIIDAEMHEREMLKDKIKKWQMQGYKAGILLENFDEKSLDQIKSEMAAFDEKIKQLIELQKELGVSMTTGIDEEEEGFEEAPIELNPNFTFDTFVVGASNRFTHAAAQAVANNPAKAYNPLFIYGGPGLGKTHLLHAIGNHIRKTKPELNVMYITTERFVNELLNAIRRNKIDAFRNKYRNVDVLLIDDIQFISGHTETQEEFFHTFNALYSARKQIVLTSDRPPKNIAKLEERLRSRFEGGLITDIQPPSLETKIIILRRIAKREGINVPDDVIHLIGSSIKSNIRKLEGALTKLIAYAKINKVEITYELAEKILKNEFLSEGGKPPEEEKAEEKKPFVETQPKIPPTSTEKKEVGVEVDVPNLIDKKLASLKQKLTQPELQKPKVAPRPIPKSRHEISAPQPQKVEAREGEKAVEEEITGEVESGVEEEVAMAECAACGNLIPLDATQCPHCGAIFEGGEEVAMAECGNCRKLIPLDATQCPYCGATFEAPTEDTTPPVGGEKSGLLKGLFKKKKKKRKK